MKSFVCSLCHNGILGGGLYLSYEVAKGNVMTGGQWLFTKAIEQYR